MLSSKLIGKNVRKHILAKTPFKCKLEGRIFVYSPCRCSTILINLVRSISLDNAQYRQAKNNLKRSSRDKILLKKKFNIVTTELLMPYMQMKHNQWFMKGITFNCLKVQAWPPNRQNRTVFGKDIWGEGGIRPGKNWDLRILDPEEQLSKSPFEEHLEQSPI